MLLLAVTAVLTASLGERPRALSSGVVISQIYGGGGTTGAEYTHDFVELFNRGTSPVNLAGWSIQYASAGAAGANFGAASILITPLPDIVLGPGQYLLVQGAENALIGDPLPTPDVIDASPIPLNAFDGKVALVSDSIPLGCNGAATACSTGQRARIADLVGYGAATFYEGSGPAPRLSVATAAVRKQDGCAETDDNRGDFAAATPAARNSASPLHVCPSLPVVSIVPIHDIQGAGPVSAFDGQKVTTRGIVTAVLQHGSIGFFIQAPVADADPLTSEGVFVAGSCAFPAVGDMVTVTGTVQETNRLTAIGGSVTVVVESSGNALPDAAVIVTTEPPAPGDADWRERYEGMRVSVPDLTVVAPSGGRLDESEARVTSDGSFVCVLPGTPRPFREPGIPVDVALPAGSPPGIPRFDLNPERWLVDSLALTSGPLDVAAGDRISGAVGILASRGEDYALLLQGRDAPPAMPAAPAPGPGDVRAAAVGEFTVANLDLQRFYDATDDPGPDLVLSASAFARRLAKASLAVRQSMKTPDIIGVADVEGLKTLQAVATAVNDGAVASGEPNPGYAALLLDGHEPSGLGLGVLVKEAPAGPGRRVSVIDLAPVGLDETSTGSVAGEAAPLYDQPPMALRARITDPRGGAGFAVTVIVARFQPRDGIEASSPVGERRRAQAEFLAGDVQRRQAAGERVIVVGGFDAFPFSDGYVDVVGTLVGAPTTEPVVLPTADLVEPNLVNLADRLAAAQQYSIVRDGNAELVDHVLVTADLASRVSNYVVARVNADFPASDANDAARAERLSNRDVPIAYFTLPAADLSVSESQSADRVATSSTIDYALVVTNRSQDAAPGVVVTDALPAGTRLASWSAPAGWSCAPFLEGLSCRTAEMAGGATARLTVSAQVSCALASGDSLLNLAAVEAEAFDADLSNNRAALRADVSNTPPAIVSTAASPRVLWPVTHKFVPVSVSYRASDACDPEPKCGLSVASSEPTDGRGDGRTATDWQVVDSRSVLLRAERAGRGSGRVYTVTVTCTDRAGGSSRQATTVSVPKSR
jgi:uncharacterized protein